MTGTKIVILGLAAVLMIGCGSSGDAEAGKPADPAAIANGGGGGPAAGGAGVTKGNAMIDQGQADAVKAEGGIPN